MRRIFRDYADGSSYKAIAEALTQSGHRYAPDRPEWNKNIVARQASNHGNALQNRREHHHRYENDHIRHTKKRTKHMGGGVIHMVRPDREITIIPADEQSPMKNALRRQLRVAAYCRVSTERDE